MFTQFRSALLIFVLQACCFAVGSPEAMTKASALVRAGKVKQAEAILRSASAADPNSAALHGALGKLLFQQQKYENAVEEFGLTLQITPDSGEYTMLLSEALIGWKHFGVAVDFLNAVRSKFAKEPQFHYDLGFAYYNMNKMNEAKTEFEETLRLAPALDRAEFMLAACIATQGDAAKAAGIFRKLTKEHPSDKTYWVTLGQILGNMGGENSAEAMQACRRALALKPGDPHIQYVTATVLLKNGDFAGARPLFERLEKQGPGSLEVHVALARIYARMGDRELTRKEKVIVNELQKQKTAESQQTPGGGQYGHIEQP